MSEIQFKWSKEIVTEFIEIYKRNPCLWRNTRDKTNYNNQKRVEAYHEMLLFLKKKNYQNATIAKVKTRIHNMTYAFRTEYNKTMKSKGSGAENVYTPKLWYYNLLMFTQDPPLQSIDNVDSNSCDIFINNSVKEMNADYMNCSAETHDILPFLRVEEENTLMHQAQQSKELAITKIRKNKLDQNRNDLPNTSSKRRSVPQMANDEFDLLGMFVAAKLRKMKPLQQIWAESLMHKVITIGLIENLNETVDIVSYGQST